MRDDAMKQLERAHDLEVRRLNRRIRDNAAGMAGADSGLKDWAQSELDELDARVSALESQYASDHALLVAIDSFLQTLPGYP